MTLKYEIEDIINFKNSEKPNIYLFLQNQNMISNHIMKDICDLSASCFEKNLKPIIIEGNDLDSSQTVNQIANSIEANEIVIMLIHLNGISDKAAETLDLVFENGLVSKKLVIFLSLVINRDLEGLSTQPIQHVVRDFFTPFLAKKKIDMLLSLLSKKVFHLKS
ncbi:uncharacterized protein LOC129606896 isoform X3 [Condylostylus longicornis]|uniref:uncharacterized protein LOC129606896 isoform X3 n=1 Tax=Condylostylus longicornis TaxID=2530218 RepID=UPI00244E41D0|nr:uncharacterized protein LOC129606896 isoform X3 [Condylostylus longicornis]